MSLTIGVSSGDGVTATAVAVNIELPDSGTVVNISGHVQAVGGTYVDLSGTTVTMPAAPGSGSIYWNIQCDSITGAASVQQSPTADPAPISPTSVVVFRQRLDSGQTDPALVSTSSTPDTW